MTTCNFKFCDNFKISRLIFNCHRGSYNTDELKFHLLNQEGKKYSFTSMLPESNHYLYLKVDEFGKIISIEGDYMVKFGIKRKHFIKTYLEEAEYSTEFFVDFVKPLHEMAIKKGEAYQFLFNTNQDENPLVCSLYPCPIPGSISSTDIVVRQPQNIIEKSRIGDFILKTNGEKVPVL